jgi:chemotaxis protein histidine kinase CheA
MDDECRRLETIGRRVETGDRSPETLEALYTAAHDIKGEAATFGYPRVATLATLLCAMLDSPRKRAQASAEAISRVIGRMRAAVEQHPK